MSDAVLIALFTALPPTLAALAALVVSMRTDRTVTRTDKTVSRGEQQLVALGAATAAVQTAITNPPPFGAPSSSDEVTPVDRPPRPRRA